MTLPVDVEDVMLKVRQAIAEALARDLETVQPSSLLMADLGAESIDYLDVVFRVERMFNIQITRGEMERAAKGTMSDEEFAPAGIISEAGLQRLRELMPEASAQIKAGLRPVQILSLFSVQTFVNLVVAKLQGLTA